MTATTTDLYRRQRTPAEERRRRELSKQLVASGTVAPDSPGAGRPAAGPGEALISQVHPHPGNIRSELGDLEETVAHGILQPLTVEPRADRRGHPRRRGRARTFGR